MKYAALRVATVLSLLVTALALAETTPERGTVLWSNALDSDADFAALDRESTRMALDGRTAVLQISKSATEGSELRSLVLPAERLRGCWVYLSADVRALDVSPKPKDWNGIKVMLKIETPGETQWPQIALPVDSFDWQRRSTRVLVPDDATTIALILGLEQVSGTVWLDDLRVTLAKTKDDAPAAPVDAPIFRGHSLPSLRGAMVHPRMKREDLRILAEDWGGNLIRWQLLRLPTPEEALSLDAYDRWLAGELDILDSVLGWADEFGVKVVVDLHSPPCGPVGGGGTANAGGRFWTTPAAQEHFVEVWRRIALRYQANHGTIWGFDLLNEPDDRSVTEVCDDWQTLAGRAARAIRDVDPERTLIVEPPAWGGAPGFIGFRPLDLPRIVYSFHMYTPFEYTHQGVDGPAETLTYPGRIGEKEWDRAALEAAMAPAVEFARKYRVHLYVGEFSAIRWAPGADRYLADLTGIFESYGWDWSYHAFREWHGWNLELGPDRQDLQPSAAPTERQQAIRARMPPRA